MYKGLASPGGHGRAGGGGPRGRAGRQGGRAPGHSWDSYDFFYFHVKKTDSTGEDGDFHAKVHKIEAVRRVAAAALLALGPDVIAIVGDHSTPSKLMSHSWHPVPLLIHSQYARKDMAAQRYTEEEAQKGTLGLRRGTDVMPLLMANALKLQKYGA